MTDSTNLPHNLILNQKQRPDLAEAIDEMAHSVLTTGQLPATLKQMILVAISVNNDCAHCASYHPAVLNAFGIPNKLAERIVADPELTEVPPTYRPVLKFALKTAQDPNSITDADYGTLHDVGLSDEEIMEVAMIASFTAFLNTWTSVSDIPSN